MKNGQKHAQKSPLISRDRPQVAGHLECYTKKENPHGAIEKI
jgi:hypothetical protein